MAKHVSKHVIFVAFHLRTTEFTSKQKNETSESRHRRSRGIDGHKIKINLKVKNILIWLNSKTFIISKWWFSCIPCLPLCLCHLHRTPSLNSLSLSFFHIPRSLTEREREMGLEIAEPNTCIRGCCTSKSIPLQLPPSSYALLSPIARGNYFSLQFGLWSEALLGFDS